MFRYKSNKQALIIAALVILLCLVCLTGATLALFSSDLADGTIGVVTTSGDVEVDILDAYGNSLKDQALSFVTFDNEPPEFEPGATFYTQEFTVVNTGNVHVQFSLSISKDEDFEDKDIADAFEIWIVPADDPDYKNAEHSTNFKGTLKVGDSSVSYVLIVKMKETAGNELQGKQFSGIGITVYAVQANAEIWGDL